MTAKKPTRRTAARRLTNISRAAGPPTPPSGAATAPPDGPMFNPLEEEARRKARAAEFAEAVQAGAVQAVGEEATIDAEAAVAELVDEGQIDPDDAEQLRRDIERVRALKRTYSGQGAKLALPPRPGYHTHWFNDEGGRIDDALSNGWAHRLDREKRPYRRAVGTGRDKGVLYAFAMDIPEVFWLEDMAARHERYQARMDALKSQPFMAKKGQAQATDRGKFYDPTDTGSPLTIEKSNDTTQITHI